ncbi:DNA gyrase subunit A, partial [Staphylococcus epidermidis]|uniref:DNA gyrase subunit A n=1 Tax=Staphylococcus epidermidis TaxID=1282 RepID=UPI0037D9CDEB
MPRYKALRQINPHQLSQTTINPQHPSIFQLTLQHPIHPHQTFQILIPHLLQNPTQFIQDNALYPNLDFYTLSTQLFNEHLLIPQLPQSTINQPNITTQIPQSFLHYPVTLILSPPLPHLTHPLNPLHPPILYPLNQQPITPHKPYNKSPPILPHVIPKYHPHPHSSIYQPILTIPQHFTYPYPLLDAQPNFPSIHPHRPPA